MKARHSDFCPTCGKRASTSQALNDCLCAPGHAQRAVSITGGHPASQPYPVAESPAVLPLDGAGDHALSSDAVLIAEECDALKAMLLEKNRAYGSSALSPIRIFSKADTVEQIKVRLDDKLSRLVCGTASGEDVVLDLLGYLILLRIATRGAP